MSLSVSGVTPVFFTRSSQEEKLKRPSSMNWLLVSPMLEKIPTPTESEVSLLRSLMSCGPIPLAKVRPPAALVPPFCLLFNKEKSPRVETATFEACPSGSRCAQRSPARGASCASPAPPGQLG